MTITFLGNFSVDFTSESHYLKTFKELGHEVIALQEGKSSSQQILKNAQKSDLFFWVHTHGWNTDGISKVLKILKEKNIPTVGYHLDLWLGIERERDLTTDPYWDIEYFFSVDMLMVEYLNANPSLPKAFFLNAGVLGSECCIGEQRTEYRHDIIFVGSRNYHKEWPYRLELINWLENTYGKRFALYGSDGYGVKRGTDLNNLYASAKIVIGDTLCKGFDYPFYFSDRIFETTGRGGFLIHPDITGIKGLFQTQGTPKDGEFDTSKTEVITYDFNDFDNLEYLIDYYLHNEEERKAIQMRGHKRTKREHTYAHRLLSLLYTIKNES